MKPLQRLFEQNSALRSRVDNYWGENEWNGNAAHARGQQFYGSTAHTGIYGDPWIRIEK